MKGTILAVDDERHMLTLLERIIREKTPYEITVTSTSLEVPEILKDRSFDVLVTDLRMPGLSGLDLLKQLSEAGRPELVIMMTAFGSLESVTEALSFGLFDYITKPFKKEQIIATLDRAMAWQTDRKMAERMHSILKTEPYEPAINEFEQEYIRRLADRSGHDAAQMVIRSGLPREKIVRILEKISTPDGDKS